MKVRTIRRHGNGHAPQYWKNPGRKYELPDREASILIAAGLVAEDVPAKASSASAGDEADGED